MRFSLLSEDIESSLSGAAMPSKRRRLDAHDSGDEGAGVKSGAYRVRQRSLPRSLLQRHHDVESFIYFLDDEAPVRTRDDARRPTRRDVRAKYDEVRHTSAADARAQHEKNAADDDAAREEADTPR